MRVCEKLQVEVGPGGHQGPFGSLIARGQEVRWHITPAWPWLWRGKILNHNEEMEFCSHSQQKVIFRGPLKMPGKGTKKAPWPKIYKS